MMNMDVYRDGRNALAHRQPLTDEQRQALLGIPPDADSLARLFTHFLADWSLVAERRGDANRFGCAVQLAVLRHPGAAPASLDRPPEARTLTPARRPTGRRWPGSLG